MGRKGPIPPLLTGAAAEMILEGKSRVSLDLGLSRVDVLVEEGRARLPDGSVVGFADLERIRGRGDAVFFPLDGGLFQVAISNGHFYKLVPTEGAPTLEIDGIRMHRTKGTTPEADAREKIEALGASRGSVLDTCAGLGYTALAAIRRGVDLVVSFELRPEVLRIAGMNPWSWGLFSDGRVHLLVGDAFDLVGALPEGFFDHVVHDPPRFARAGLLYGAEFYVLMHRVLQDGGRLFHYTGEPGSRHRHIDLRRGVMRRLREAGFRRLKYDAGTLGVVGEKARR